MKIKIIETGKIEELILIDPKSGANWVGDLVGNDLNIDYNTDTEIHECSQETFNWWVQLTKNYQTADDRWHDLYINAPDFETQVDMDEALRSIGGCDLENYPRYLNDLCNDFDK